MNMKRNMVFMAPDGNTSSDFDFVDFNETPPVVTITPEVESSLRTLPIFVVIDTSGSMRHERISAVNMAMRGVADALRKRQDMDAAYSIAVMTFSDRAKWLMPKPIPVKDYIYEDIDAEPYITSYGSAFTALEAVLHRGEYLEVGQKDYYMPMFLFVTDGEPTDTQSYPKALDKLKNNNWFVKGTKYALAIGSECKSEDVKNTLVQFCGDTRNIRYADNVIDICKNIETILISGSKIASHVQSVGKETNENNDKKNDVRNDNQQQSQNQKNGNGGSGLFDSNDPNLWGSMFANT